LTDAALSDLRVIDLSLGVAGPYCTKLLADCGAEVIKIEPPAGDVSRRLGPFPEDLPHPEKSGLFLHLNTNKKSVTLDVATTSGVVILRKLLARADVLVESSPPGRMDELGIGYEQLRQDFPRLIYASITSFGQTGPYRDYGANSLVAMAMSSIMYNTGEPDREPLVTGTEPAGYFAGLQAFVGILAALVNRERNGPPEAGEHVDVSLVESAAAADEYNAAMYAFMGAIRRRFYSRHVFGYPMDILPSQDGHVVVIPGAEGFPRPLMQEGVSLMALLLENPDLDQNPLFLRMQERYTRWQELDELLLPWLTAHPSRQIVETAQELRMPFALVPTVADLLEDAHLAARGFFEEIEHPGNAKLRHAGAPFQMSETPWRTAPAPTLGQDNEAVLGEAGYDRQDLGILRDRGVI
jgi:crotonobetainyl-CoA:carnitine CoA-transferase CaiB-like acyl-CoA transferase